MTDAARRRVPSLPLLLQGRSKDAGPRRLEVCHPLTRRPPRRDGGGGGGAAAAAASGSGGRGAGAGAAAAAAAAAAR
eukprot:scaffold1318_cov388-Prasinococcus_capsulatus_cf.AAC.70